MADTPRTEATWEPGTLDNTRKNIGAISEEEAKRMTKVLGGEILAEKSAPIDYDALPKAKDYNRKVVVGKVSKNATNVAGSAGNSTLSTATKKSTTQLPEISSKERNLMDRMMMHSDYKIKQNYGFFNFVRKFKKNGLETLHHTFISFTLKADLDHLNTFIDSVKNLILLSPETYKSKILTSNEDKFRVLRTIGSWNLKELKLIYGKLETLGREGTVVDMIPFTKAVYKMLLKVYYIGENKISNYFKDIYGELAKYPKVDKNEIAKVSKTAIAEWFYVYSQIIKGLYPLLMRMCAKKFDYFQDFFLVQTANIFAFLGITKYDLILPTKNGENPPVEEIKIEKTPEEIEAEEEKKEKEKEEKNKQNAQKERKMQFVKTGLKLLDQLFPDAGFDELASYPDMYPYFQPIYQFRDGYNLLSPFNPLQVTITLLRISEDLVQGLRNVIFTMEDTDTGKRNSDKISDILNEWTVYRNELFERFYSEQICEFVNKQYTQAEFKDSLFGKKLITSMLWQTKYNFLPHFEFEQLLLERPKNDSQYKPLCMRVDFMFDFLYQISKSIESVSKTKGDVMGVSNPWARYDFEIPNAVSKRMDVLLGAKRPDDETAATNASLIKYSLYVIAVLDWWVNDESSPAYLTDSSKIYRISPDDGAPLFSVPERNDQNKLFAQKVKSAIEQKKNEN